LTWPAPLTRGAGPPVVGPLARAHPPSSEPVWRGVSVLRRRPL